MIGRQRDLILSGLQQFSCEIDSVLFNERVACFYGLSSEKRVGHGAADQQIINGGEERFDNSHLVRNFCASNNGHEWPFQILSRLRKQLTEVFDFFLD